MALVELPAGQLEDRVEILTPRERGPQEADHRGARADVRDQLAIAPGSPGDVDHVRLRPLPAGGELGRDVGEDRPLAGRRSGLGLHQQRVRMAAAATSEPLGVQRLRLEQELQLPIVGAQFGDR